MEPEGSLPHSQVPATCPYPEPALTGRITTPAAVFVFLNSFVQSWHNWRKW